MNAFASIIVDGRHFSTHRAKSYRVEVVVVALVFSAYDKYR